MNKGRPRNIYKGLPLQPMICAVQHPIKLTGIKVNDHASKGGIPSGNMCFSVPTKPILSTDFESKRLGQLNKANPQRCTIKLISRVWNKYCRSFEKHFPAIVKRRLGV